ncbi:DMT family transporter [Rhodobacteraceae bacterium NNCM2]|nr:DMT family transporter [Coraliihabitans acroporae]
MSNPSSPLIGVAIMAAAMMLLPVGDAISKYLTEVTIYGGSFLAWSRFVVVTALVGPYAAATGAFRGLGWGFVFRQALRGAILSGAISCILQAVERAPLADVYGAFFIGPSLATIMAVVLLKERVGWTEWAAVLLGFVGVVFIVQPTGEVSPGLLWAMASGTCFGAFMVATRWTTGTAPPIAQLAGQMFFGFLFLAPLGMGDIFRLGIVEWEWLVLAGITSGASNLFQILAFRHAGAAYLAPLVYAQILSATALSWLIFGDVLNVWAAIGICIILSAALFKVPWKRVLGR